MDNSAEDCAEKNLRFNAELGLNRWRQYGDSRELIFVLNDPDAQKAAAQRLAERAIDAEVVIDIDITPLTAPE